MNDWSLFDAMNTKSSTMKYIQGDRVDSKHLQDTKLTPTYLN